jgi:crotonobetainyl-CoA:carnitine CoA-transferase CaiB-like acyl-CoA transferase
MLTLEHEVLGTIRMPASPITMSDTPAVETTPPPPLGAHTRDILREHNYDDPSIDSLIDSGVVYTRDRLIERGDAANTEAG